MGIIAAVVVALIKWIQRLSEIGGVDESVTRLEQATLLAIDRLAASPTLGGVLRDTAAVRGQAITATEVGFVQLVDTDRLAAIAEAEGCAIHVARRPGCYLDPGLALAIVDPAPAAGTLERIRAAFVIGPVRTFEADVGYGLVVLSEVASRSLSPAVNDPGSVIGVIISQTRAFCRLAGCAEEAVQGVDTARSGGLSVTPIDCDRLLEDAFAPIVRHWAGMVEVQEALHRGLGTIRVGGSPALAAAATRLSEHAMARARAALSAPEDLARLEEAAGGALRRPSSSS